MTKYDIIPANDAERLGALHRYKILDAPADEAFNNIARIMADVFRVPVALISLVDKEKVFFKGNVGLPGVHYTERGASLCSFAVLSPDPTVFEEPLKEPCLLANPLVHGSFGLRFYAGAPLITNDGYNIGAVCLVDKKPRHFTDDEKATLVRFSKLVMEEIELRHTALIQYEFEKALMQSKERFELVAKATQDAIWDWDLKTNNVWWNEGFKSLFGYSADEIEPDLSSWHSRLHPDDRARVVSSIYQVIDEGKTNWSAEYRFRKKDGSYATVFDRGYAMHDQNGRMHRMLGSIQDITERKHLEDSARENEARTRLAVESARIGTYEIDLNQKSIIHSPRAAEIFGLDPAKKWPYRAFIGAIHPNDAATWKKTHEMANESGNLFYEIRVVMPDGAIRWIRLNGSLIKQEKSALLIGTSLDITEEKEAATMLEEKIRERTMELHDVNEQLTQFVYAASHDLQEPLRKISFFTDRLLSNVRPLANEEDHRLADRIQHTIVRMRNLIDDLLSYSNTNLKALCFADVNLNETLREVLDDMEAAIIESKAVVEVGELPVLKGDRSQLKQLFQNLVSNAIKYRKKDVPPLVEVRAEKVHGDALKKYDLTTNGSDVYYRIEIKDNGIGFAQEDAKKIFCLFQRLHGKAEYEGTGVGLALVQKVVDNHYGCIVADGKPGEGASFKVLLPGMPD